MFEPFPKIPRLKRGCVVTEKIDGTNAQVIIDDDYYEPEKCMREYPVAVVEGLRIFAGSRTRLITPGKATDNFGFAAWVQEHAEELVKLGHGRHFGEWWGKGIQRGYGLDHKRFSLFNTSRPAETLPACCFQVPVIYTGDFDTAAVDRCMDNLLKFGSYASGNGYPNPEGVIVYLSQARSLFKQTFDDNHKEAA
jgi:hypothetical protein